MLDIEEKEISVHYYVGLTSDWCLLGFQLREGTCSMLKLLRRFNSTLNINIPELRQHYPLCSVDFRGMPKDRAAER